MSINQTLRVWRTAGGAALQISPSARRAAAWWAIFAHLRADGLGGILAMARPIMSGVGEALTRATWRNHRNRTRRVIDHRSGDRSEQQAGGSRRDRGRPRRNVRVTRLVEQHFGGRPFAHDVHHVDIVG